MSATLAWIVKTGARAPSGLSAEQVAMSVRAKKMEPMDTRFVGRTGEPLGACRMLALPETVHGYDRLIRIAAPAICEAWPEGAATPIPLLLALPEPGRADDDPRFEGAFIADLAALSGRPIDLPRSRIVRAGQAGGAFAFEAAAAMFGLPGAPAEILVGGVDSHYHPDVLARLDREYLVHGPGTVDGFIPSEGAAFVALSRRKPEARPPLASLRAVRTAREATIETGEPNIGAATTAILHQLEAESPVAWTLPGLNGESWRVREWTMAGIRVFAGRDVTTTELLEELGDVGAATGPLLASIACTYFAVGCAPAREAVIALLSDGPERGVLRIEAAS